MPRKYQLPQCLQEQRIAELAFLRWLQRKATAHVRRDRQRGYTAVTVAAYKRAILQAVVDAKGVDYFTGAALDWHRISQWDNAEAARGRGEYKREFWNLPTVDHENPRNPRSPLRLCSWRVNDSKNDQTLEEYLNLAETIRAHQDRASKNRTGL